MKNRIKELRLKNNMSQKQLAEKAGVSQQVLSFYETGDRTPKLETWIKLSTVFGVPVPYAVASPAIDFKSEGLVTGMAAKMFTVAGPVIVFGVAASVVYGVVLMLL